MWYRQRGVCGGQLTDAFRCCSDLSFRSSPRLLADLRLNAHVVQLRRQHRRLAIENRQLLATTVSATCLTFRSKRSVSVHLFPLVLPVSALFNYCIFMIGRRVLNRIPTCLPISWALVEWDFIYMPSCSRRISHCLSPSMCSRYSRRASWAKFRICRLVALNSRWVLFVGDSYQACDERTCGTSFTDKFLRLPD